MKAKNLLGEKMIDNHKAAIPGMSKLKTDQYYGTYQWSKDVAGHDGKKQTAPKIDNDEFNDTAVVGGLSNTEHTMAKKAAKGKVTTVTGPGSKENKDIQTKSPLTKVKENNMSEARMSAAVKLQRAWEREKAKSDASRKRGEEVMAQAKKDAEKKSKEQGMAKGLNEFAPPGSNDGGDDGFSEETLKRLASQWYNGDEDPRVERTLMAAGWEIGQDEGYDDEPGVFVVQSGDVNGNSYISWPAHELKQGVAEGLNEMDKTQTPPGRDGDIDWTKKQIHLGPERMMKAKDVAKHALKALDKTMKKSTPKKKGVAEGAMPASVIKQKESIRLASDEENKKRFKGKTKAELAQMARRHGYKDKNPYAKFHDGITESIQDVTEFAPAGGGTPPRGPKTPGKDPWGGNDGPGDDPYSRPEPEYYSRSIDFFGQFEADHFDKEDFNKKTGVFKGYWENNDGSFVQIAYFKFDDPRQAAREFDDSPGMGWYYEPVDESVKEDPDRLGKGLDIIFYVKHNDGSRTYANVKNKEHLAQLQQKFKGEEIKTLDGNHPEVQAWLEKRRVGPSKLWPGAEVTMYPAAYEPHHSMKEHSPMVQQQIAKDRDQALKNTGASEVIRDLIQGSLDGYDVMVHPRTPAQKVVSKMMQQKYDDVAIDHRLHPDDDFEEIINRIIDSFEEDYGVDESLQQVSEVNPHNYDSDIDYYNALKRVGKKYERDPDDYEPEEPYDPYVEFEREQERRRAKTAHLEPNVEYSKDEGQAPNGKRYNMTVKFTSPDSHRADYAADRWMDLEWGAKKLVDKEQHEHDGKTTVTIYVQDNHKHGYWKPWKDEEPISKGITFEAEKGQGYRFDSGPKFIPKDTLGTDMSYHWGTGGGNKYGIDSKLGPRQDPRFGKRGDGKQGYRPEYQRPSEYGHGTDSGSPRDGRRAELDRLLSMYGRYNTKLTRLQSTNRDGRNDSAISELTRQIEGIERSIIDMGGEQFLRHYRESVEQTNELKLLEQTFVSRLATKYKGK